MTRLSGADGGGDGGEPEQSSRERASRGGRRSGHGYDGGNGRDSGYEYDRGHGRASAYGPAPEHGRDHDRSGLPEHAPPHDARRGRNAADDELAFEPGDEDGWQRLARGYRVAGLLLSAHRMGLLRTLADSGPQTSEQLADHLHADRRLLADICRALRAAGLLVEDDGRWQLGPAGRRLADDPAASLELDAMAEDYQRWGELDRHARLLWRDGRTDPRTHDAADLDRNEQAARRYTRRMSSRRRLQAGRLIGHVEPTRPVTVLDAWGGDGYIARQVCAAWPQATCIVLEQATVARIAAETCAGHPRIAVATGSILDDDPADALAGATVDVVVLSHVLQSVPEERRRQLSSQAARVLAPGGCLLSSEFVVQYDDRDSLDVLLWSIARRSANWQSDALRATRQDMLLRGSGLAAVASWWVTQSTRAVLGVKPAAGVEPALRTRH